MMPCNSQTECGASRCHGFGATPASIPYVSAADLLNTLNIAQFYDQNDGTNYQIALDFYEKLLSLGRQLVYGVSAPWAFGTANLPLVDFTICSPSMMDMQNDWVLACTSEPPIMCPGLSHWDGILSSGGSAFDPLRMSGAAWRVGSLAQKPVTPLGPGSPVILLDLNCDGQLSLLPNQGLNFPGIEHFLRLYGDLGYDPILMFTFLEQPLSINLPLLTQLYSEAWNFLKGVEQQRANQRGDLLSDLAFSLTWAWEQFFYDWVYAPNGKPPVDHGPNMSNLRTFLFDALFGGETPYEITLPPNTCSYARWAQSGICTGEYTGLGVLFNTDITIRVVAKRCGSALSGKLPAFQIQCVGTGCSVFQAPVSCTSDAGCGKGLICRPLNSQAYVKTSFDPLFLAAIIEGTTSQFLNDTQTQKCAGYSYYQQDILSFLNKMNPSIGTNNNICLLNYTRVSEPGVYATPELQWWLQTSVDVVGKLVKLAWFQDWSF